MAVVSEMYVKLTTPILAVFSCAHFQCALSENPLSLLLGQVSWGALEEKLQKL